MKFEKIVDIDVTDGKSMVYMFNKMINRIFPEIRKIKKDDYQPEEEKL